MPAINALLFSKNYNEKVPLLMRGYFIMPLPE